MTKRDYYEILEIDKSASKSDIKKAYRKLAKTYHPDRNKSEDAETKFKEIQEAYEVLSDDQKRQAYDKFGHAGTEGFQAGGGAGFSGFNDFGDFSNINDIFEQFFGSGFQGFGQNPQGGNRAAVRGADLEVNFKISFNDAVFGITKTLQYKRQIICEQCHGTGAKDESSKITCSTCKGQGQVIRVQNAFMFGTIRTQAICPDCHGEGKVIKDKCKKCSGETRYTTDDKFTIKIPPGIPDGVTLRFKDRGNAGKKGGNYGDLYINIEVEEHERLERRGNDIYTNIEINAIQATLGDEVVVPSVHGDLTIKIPSGTQPDTIIKLSGKGGPKFKGNGNGDEYVKVKVIIPTKLSREERRIWEELKSL